MVTGIETAGLVLGAFPLAIEAIKIYCNGVQTMKDMVKYQEILSMFEYEISLEDFFFRQTVEGLLEDNLQLPKSDIIRLMDDPGGELWKSANIHAGLQELLKGNEAVKHFLKTAKILAKTLQEIASKFGKVSLMILNGLIYLDLALVLHTVRGPKCSCTGKPYVGCEHFGPRTVLVKA